MVPAKYYLDQTQFFYVTLYGFVYLALYCDRGLQIVFNSVMLAFTIFFTYGVGYHQETTELDLVESSLMVFFYFILMSLLAMITSYI